MRIFQGFSLGIVVVFAAFLSAPFDVGAHGAGLTFTSTTTDGMIIDVDYGDLYISAGSAGRFDFNLFTDGSRDKTAEFSKVWVRISKNIQDSKSGETVYAGYVSRQLFGGNGFSILLPAAGTYTLKARYEADSESGLGDTLAEAEFILDVAPPWGEEQFKYQSKEFKVGVGSGFLIAALLCIAWFFRKRIFKK